MLFEIGPLGILHLVTYLQQKGQPTRCVFLAKLDPETPEELETICSFVEAERPTLIGFSLMSFNFRRAQRATIELKRRFPEIPIVWGGIHPTFNPEESIQFADYVCIGEGENALLELVRAIEHGLETDDIPNIWSRRNGRVTRTDLRPLIQDLDEYPFPRFDWENTFCLDDKAIKPLTRELYRKHVLHGGAMYDVMASRGCPYSCSYCCNSLFRVIYRNKGRYVRYRSVDSVIEELKYATREFPFVSMINIQDDGFAAAPEPYLKEFSEKYKRQVGLPIRLRIIPTMFSEAKARYLSDANALVAVVGIQSSDRINREVFNRRGSTENLLQVARLLRKYRIVGQYDLIVQNPYESEDDLVEVCNTLASLPKPYRLEMFPLAMFPNTPLRTRALADGIPVDDNDGYVRPYGAYPIRYPYLFALQRASELTPGIVLKYFLRHRQSRLVRRLFDLYYRWIYQNVDRAREHLMRRTALLGLTKKAIFVPITLAGSVRRLYSHLRRI